MSCLVIAAVVVERTRSVRVVHVSDVDVPRAIANAPIAAATRVVHFVN